ncbi:TonB-dependent siderophore receptor [Nitrospina watsonii]|nr:TonB-dependent receptor [Nitrospina watsonii]
MKPFQVAQSGDPMEFDIQAQDLNAALLEYADRTGIQIMYESSSVAGMRSSGVQGTYTPEEALKRILKGTGIKHKFVDNTRVTLVGAERVMELSPIDVIADDYVGLYMSERAISATRTGVENKDIPQKIEVYNRNMLDDTRSNNVGEVLRFSPGAVSDGGSFGAFADNFNFRGFSAASNMMVNGLRGGTRMITARDTSNVERVEILKGPSSVMYGQMQPSAVVNVVTKQPLDFFHAEGGFQLGSFDSYRLTTDVGGPISDDKRIKYRLNVAYEDRESFIRFWDREHIFIAPVVTMDLNEDTKWTVEGTYSADDWSNFYNGQPASGLLTPNPNGKYDPSISIGEPNFGGTSRSNISVMSRLEHRFSDWLIGRFNFSWMQTKRNFEEVFPDGLQADGRTLNREFFVSPGDTSQDFFFLLDVNATFDTGSLAHEVVVGADFRNNHGDFHTNFAAMGTLDIFNPVYNVSSKPSLVPRTFIQDIKTLGFFLQDRITVFENLKLLGGFRYAYSDLDSEFAAAGGPLVPFSRTDDAFTTQFGAVYQPWETVSVFFNRTESFVPQDGSTAGGTPFAPESGEQYEGGFKVDFLDGRANATLSYFHITQSNMATNDPNNPGFDIAVGESQSQGVELSVQAEPVPGWNLLTSYGFTETEVTKDNSGLQGNTFRNVPSHTFALQSRYDFQTAPWDKFSVNGSVQHVSTRFANANNTFRLPGYVRVDVGGMYRPTDKLDVGFFVENLFDEQIFASGFRQNVFLQNPRTFQGVVRFRY